MSFALQGNIQSGESLDSLCKGLAALHSPTPSEDIGLDLRGVKGLTSGALALLVANLRLIRRKRMIEPLEHFAAPLDCTPPLTQVDLQSLLADRAGFGLHEGGDAIGLRPCEPFSTAGGVTRAVSALQMRVGTETRWDSVDVASLGAMAADLAENVLQHARSGAGGVAALRTFPTEETVELAIADCGVGIRRSLVENPEFQDLGTDLSAIKAAVKPGATADPGSGGGYGLFLARLVVLDNGGVITIRSGHAEWSEGDRGIQRVCDHDLGTTITVRARTDRPFNYDRVDDFLEDPVGFAD
jgi:anti-sigma regulatory factor (Ser/Thr protein kinase)